MTGTPTPGPIERHKANRVMARFGAVGDTDAGRVVAVSEPYEAYTPDGEVSR